MAGKSKGGFDDGNGECMFFFFVFGNYFALFGLKHSSNALKAHLAGDDATAKAESDKAKAWARWGMIPATIINVALIFWAIRITLKMLPQLIDGLALKI